jgi:hypothetical protein
VGLALLGTVLSLADCSSDDGVSTSVGVSYGRYYRPGWYGGYYCDS